MCYQVEMSQCRRGISCFSTELLGWQEILRRLSISPSACDVMNSRSPLHILSFTAVSCSHSVVTWTERYLSWKSVPSVSIWYLQWIRISTTASCSCLALCESWYWRRDMCLIEVRSYLILYWTFSLSNSLNLKSGRKESKTCHLNLVTVGWMFQPLDEWDVLTYSCCWMFSL